MGPHLKKMTSFMDDPKERKVPASGNTTEELLDALETQSPVKESSEYENTQDAQTPEKTRRESGEEVTAVEFEYDEQEKRKEPKGTRHNGKEAFTPVKSSLEPSHPTKSESSDYYPPVKKS